MERDRQGFDSRFNDTPTSLDVYLFIFDRFRQIKADLAVQNFVKAGKCDPAAVRINERIVRWYILIDHQLSDVDDYSNRITGQKQQNGQEVRVVLCCVLELALLFISDTSFFRSAQLSRAMTTLNDLYDDPYGRQFTDVLSPKGNHGCDLTNSTVRGPTPVDYDGTVLEKSPSQTDVAKRIIGNEDAPLAGTAESEMRALYILLIMNQSLEVNTFLLALAKRTPKVFHSSPVQLAITVYSAYSNDNYMKVSKRSERVL